MHAFATALVTTLVAVAGCSPGADATPVLITVKSDGKSCVVDHREAPCSSLMEVLTEKPGMAKRVDLTVSPEGCGDSAMAQAQRIAGDLKRLGFTRIAVVGFLSEPNSDCR